MVASPPVSVDSVAADLERLEPTAVASAVEVLAAEGTPLEEILDGTLLPAWDRVEARNRSGDAGAAVASAAAALARRAILGASRLARRAPAGSAGPLTVVSPGSAVDLLHSEAVAEVAGAAGWVVQQVDGADAAGELSAYVRRRRPVAVVVTAHDPAELLALLPVVGVAHSEGLSLLAWGAAFGEGGRRARRIGADGWAADLAELLRTIDSWQESSPPLASPMPLPAAYGELERLRPVIVQAALGAGDALWARRAAPALLDQLEAAVVFEDPGILAEHLGRERRGQVDDARIVGLVDAVASALPISAGVARDYVVAARDELRRSLLGPGATRAGSTGSPAAASSDGSHAGQVFADLLMLAALSCQTQLALLSVPQGSGRWRTLSYGFEVRDGLDDPRLFELIASRREPVEVADMTIHPGLVRSPLTLPPHALRWAYGMALYSPEGQVIGVVAVLDRWLRQASRREHRALSAVARQASEHLVQIRRGPVPATVKRVADVQDDPLAGLLSLRRGAAMPDGQQLMRSHEVAVLFDVTERTVINSAASGKLPSLRTIGGHLRFRREDVLGLLDGRSSGTRARRSS